MLRPLCDLRICMSFLFWSCLSKPRIPSWMTGVMLREGLDSRSSIRMMSSSVCQVCSLGDHSLCMCFDSQSVRFVWLLFNKESLVLIFRINFSGSKGMKPRLRHKTSILRPVSGSGDWLIRMWECKRFVSCLGEKSLHLHVGLMDVR